MTECVDTGAFHDDGKPATPQRRTVTLPCVAMRTIPSNDEIKKRVFQLSYLGQPIYFAMLKYGEYR
jgi:hypothetical protein